jgi:hypothetical protein
MNTLSKVIAAPAAAAALLVGAATMPAAAAAANAIEPGTYTYDTTLTPEYFGAGSYEGVLRLTVNPDGSIWGYFRDVDAGGVHTVTGGETGDEVWLDLGGFNSRPITAKVENGKIVGGIYTVGQPYAFVATPGSHEAI